jgi:acetolactate synthase-1/2/3 large subunit
LLTTLHSTATTEPSTNPVASGAEAALAGSEDMRGCSNPVFVLNNDGYSSIRASQIAYFGAASIGADAKTGLTIPDISKVAASYGLSVRIIADQRNLADDVRQVLALEGPVICDVNVLENEVRGPRVQSVQRPDGSFSSKPLEDLFPFLSREEFLENMIVKPLPE